MKHTTQHQQSMFDVALETHGTLEGVFDIIDQNNLNGPTDNIYHNDILDFTPKPYDKPPIIQYLTPYTIATMHDSIRASGIGWMVVESPHDNTFCITN